MIRSTQSPSEIPPQNLLSAPRNRVLRRRAEKELHRVRRRTNAAIRELRQSLLEAGIDRRRPSAPTDFAFGQNESSQP